MRGPAAWASGRDGPHRVRRLFPPTARDRRFGQLENQLLRARKPCRGIRLPGGKYLSSTTTPLRAKPCRARWRRRAIDVICFADGAALLSQVRTRIPVCVLLEVQMPERTRPRHSEEASRRKLSRADLRHVGEWRYRHGRRRRSAAALIDFIEKPVQRRRYRRPDGSGNRGNGAGRRMKHCGIVAASTGLRTFHPP